MLIARLRDSERWSAQTCAQLRVAPLREVIGRPNRLRASL
jgi:hypothetical protein